MIQPVCEQQESTPTPPPSEGPATAVAPRPASAREKPKVEQLPPYRVLLHNDPISEMSFVTNTIIELTPLNHEQAVEVMLEAHKTGVALVLVTHKERAELYQEQFHSKKLQVTVEPAG
jgi:ATP-dependent Clp protease adaptor protein ClpS